MEFWGVEVQAGKPLKITPEQAQLIHISQASLGEVKDVKAVKHVPLRLKMTTMVGTEDFIIGYLSAEDKPQVLFDLVFDREFELSHDCKNGSVYFMGYVADQPKLEEKYPEYPSSDGEDELLNNGLIEPKAEDVKAANGAVADAEAAKSADKAETKKEELSDSDDSDDSLDDDDDSEDSSEEDLEPVVSLDDEDDDSEDDSEDDSKDDSEDEEDSESSEEELPNPKQSKKRPAVSAQESVLAAKKAKSSTPEKTGKKKGQNATPFPSKAAGKAPSGNKPKQTPKSGGQFSGKSGNKSSNFKKSKGKR